MGIGLQDQGQQKNLTAEGLSDIVYSVCQPQHRTLVRGEEAVFGFDTVRGVRWSMRTMWRAL